MNDTPGIETYPVGLFDDVRRGRVKDGLAGYVAPQVKRGNWRAVRNYFGGYLAEWHYPPEGLNHYRCGRGWTRASARRSLMRHILESNMTAVEASR